jgi:RNA polymerase sigma-70 factor (ECF subfamily)
LVPVRIGPHKTNLDGGENRQKKRSQGNAVSAGDSFAGFLVRLQAGDSGAARELFRRFTGQLIALARRRVDGPFRHKVDPEDVVQSAYKSFFARYRDAKLEMGNWDGLWGLLTVITLRKCSERFAYHRAARRDAGREVSAPAAEERAPWTEPLGREPTPLEAVELCETVDRLLSGMDEDERAVVELSLQGYTTREISNQLGRAERTVRLLREGVRKRLQRMQRENL